MSDIKKPSNRLKILLAAALLFSFFGCAALPSRYQSLSSGLRTEISLAAVLKDVEDADVVFVGESHKTMEDHLVQLEVIKHLNGKGVKTILALEMFASGSQFYLEEYIRGGISEQELREVYGQEWNIPYHCYADIFHYARHNGIPLAAVNTERALIQDVAEKGTRVLSRQTLETVGFRDCASDPAYEKAMGFAKLAERHGQAMVHLCDAQRFRDYAMAYYIRRLAGKGRTVVVLAGAAHASGVAVPEMLRQQGYEGKIRILLPAGIKELLGAEIDSSIADYIWY